MLEGYRGILGGMVIQLHLPRLSLVNVQIPLEKRERDEKTWHGEFLINETWKLYGKFGMPRSSSAPGSTARSTTREGRLPVPPCHPCCVAIGRPIGMPKRIMDLITRDEMNNAARNERNEPASQPASQTSSWVSPVVARPDQTRPESSLVVIEWTCVCHEREWWMTTTISNKPDQTDATCQLSTPHDPQNPIALWLRSHFDPTLTWCRKQGRRPCYDYRQPASPAI